VKFSALNVNFSSWSFGFSTPYVQGNLNHFHLRYHTL